MIKLAIAIPAALLLAGCGDTATAPVSDTAPEAPIVHFAELPEAPPPVAMPTEIDPAMQDQLVSAISRIVVLQQVLASKEVTGEVLEVEAELPRESAESALENAKANLAAMSRGSIPTYVLIHNLDAAGHLRAWLIGPDGGTVSGVSDMPYDGLTAMTKGLGVRRLAMSRSRAPRGEPLPTEQEIRAAEAADRSPEAVEERRRTLAETAELLLPGVVRDALGSRSGRLLIIPALDTGTAPYAALPLANGYAAENWSFVLLPDIPALSNEEPTYDFGQVEIDKAVIVGDPDLSGDTSWNWAKLPGARAEAQAVAQMLDAPGNRLMIGEEATRRNLVRAIESRRDTGLVYIASHAVSHPRNPLTRGYVAMSGGHYYAGHIRQENFPGWDDNHPLVVLSACQTALGRTLEGGGFGIARTWTRAGAGQVAGSLWNVSDSATKVLMTNFMRQMKAGYAPEFAMQKAQLQTLRHVDDRGRQPFMNDPKMWASFTIFGKPSRQIRRNSPQT
ncbi:CHAT domain-containing protein [Altererythrobacter arenosus]|uniref:CHAT domain-containing protein n=1 Tax=Altererythrobacter arenosus TaxID=3032592 RepID=A0ABY8FT26_9SPHN|nr:CHAT domain-containing protein [Altererythrobacter sp. CAU 1644]WFL77917.1 CHAT domain-containing protein [Altererythrobacter sp. CAU 1644]